VLDSRPWLLETNPIMRPFEKLYLGVEPFLPPLHRQVRRTLLDLARAHQGRLDILDVGGRKSHYTIGVPARISISDIERKTEIQKRRTSKRDASSRSRPASGHHREAAPSQ